MIKIYPSILETNIKTFWQQLRKLLPLFPYFQIDIADGKFVPNKTIQIEEIIHTLPNSQLLISNHQLPTSNYSPSFEFHLMVDDYLPEIEKLKRLSSFIKIKKVLIHLKALKNSNYQLPITNFQYGLAINPEEDVKSNWSIIKKFSTIQIMTVNPGFQGSPFLAENLEKINELKNLGYKGLITLDGGINDKTLPIILKNKYQPDILFPGSFLREKTKKRLKILREIITSN